MKILLVIFSFFTSVIGQPHCVKCDIEKVKVASTHIDSLTFQIVQDFLCTFDSTCRFNIEFSEWSNEILYRVLEKSPSLFFKAITKKNVDTNILLKEIENPIQDFNYQQIYDTIKSIVVEAEMKQKVLNALIVAAAKDDLKIKQ